MKPLLKAACAGLILFSGQALSLNPVPGFYGGITLGGSTAASSLKYKDSASFPPSGIIPASTISIDAELKYSAFGNIGGQLGYRFDDFRAEIEPFYNHSPYNSITIDGTLSINGIGTISKRINLTDTKVAQGRTYIKGSTDTMSVMLNGYFDFFPLVGRNANFVPYIGVGIGYSNINNRIKLVCDGQTLQVVNGVVDLSCSGSAPPPPVEGAVPAKVSNNTTSMAAQGIFGMNYFMDDYTTVGLDFRAYSSRSTKPFDERTQFYAVNLLFNGSFNFG